MNGHHDIRSLGAEDRDKFVDMVHAYLTEIAPTLDHPGQEKIAQFWEDPTKHALTFHDPDMFGFALIRTLPTRAHEISEFYIAPSHRRRGYGKAIANDVVRRFPGRWQLGIASGFPGARAFWLDALSDFRIKRGPPLTRQQSGSLHFFVTETVT